jgi:hypothetical protein
LVSIVPSSNASGAPVSPSSNRYWPKIEGSDRRPLSGKTETIFTPIRPEGPRVQAGISSRVASAEPGPVGWAMV